MTSRDIGIWHTLVEEYYKCQPWKSGKMAETKTTPTSNDPWYPIVSIPEIHPYVNMHTHLNLYRNVTLMMHYLSYVSGFQPLKGNLLLGHLLQLGVEHKRDLKPPPSMPCKDSQAMEKTKLPVRLCSTWAFAPSKSHKPKALGDRIRDPSSEKSLKMSSFIVPKFLGWAIPKICWKTIADHLRYTWKRYIVATYSSLSQWTLR